AQADRRAAPRRPRHGRSREAVVDHAAVARRLEGAPRHHRRHARRRQQARERAGRRPTLKAVIPRQVPSLRGGQGRRGNLHQAQAPRPSEIASSRTALLAMTGLVGRSGPSRKKSVGFWRLALAAETLYHAAIAALRARIAERRSKWRSAGGKGKLRSGGASRRRSRRTEPRRRISGPRATA